MVKTDCGDTMGSQTTRIARFMHWVHWRWIESDVFHVGECYPSICRTGNRALSYTKWGDRDGRLHMYLCMWVARDVPDVRRSERT